MYRYGSVNDVGIGECERMCVTYLNQEDFSEMTGKVSAYMTYVCIELSLYFYIYLSPLY